MSRYRVITVEDTRESLTIALKEMHDALMKGSGIGFDLRMVKPKGRKASLLKEIDQEYLKATISKRTIKPR